jgi:ubiquinone/menaquinone biosynthesis C-methylase UbiE
VEFEYRETGKDLQARIDIHAQYGKRDIEQWMLDLLKPQKGLSILDVACGAGKQCMAFYTAMNGEVDLVGGDVSSELLDEARNRTPDEIRYMHLDFNKPFEFADDTFDIVTCCFAIYYAEDIPFTVREMRRVTKPGGRLFTTGPMPQNKQTFYEIIKEGTGTTIPPMPGSSRYSTEIFTEIQGLFQATEQHIFENPLIFNSADPFMKYTRASLSEDRKLWSDLFSGTAEFEHVMTQIETAARKRAEAQGELVMTKVVGGFLATK